MRLYHGTSRSAASLIAEQGIVPRGDRPSNWRYEAQVPTLPDFVYLTKVEDGADFQGTRTALIHGEREYAIVSVDLDCLDEALRYPDENLFKREGTKIVTTEEMRRYQSMMLANRSEWRRSLETIGMLAYHGVVPPDRLSIETRSVADSPWRFLADETWTIEEMNLKFNLLNWALEVGHPVTTPENVHNRTIRFTPTGDGGFELDYKTGRCVFPAPLEMLEIYNGYFRAKEQRHAV